MIIQTSPDLVAFMLADARLPSGGHTQSAGLEPAVRAGLGAHGRRLDEIGRYARDRLRTVARVEAGTAVLARHLVRAGRSPGEVIPHWAARTPSQALRAASRRQGRALWRLGVRVWPEVGGPLPSEQEVPRAVVLGTICAVTGLSPDQTARLAGYDDAQTVISASGKLLPVDPIAAACWLAELHPDVEALVQAVAGLTEVAELPAPGVPFLDLLAEQHVTERMRLFHA